MEFHINSSISIEIQEDTMNINSLIKTLNDFSRYVLGKEILSMVVSQWIDGFVNAYVMKIPAAMNTGDIKIVNSTPVWDL